MKKALLAAVGALELADQVGIPPLNNIVSEAVELSALLSDPSFGSYKIQYSFDNRSALLHEHLSQFFGTAHAADELLFYYSGHGLRAPDGTLLLTATNTHNNNLIETTISSSLLCELTLASKAKKVAIVVDCCYGKGLIQAFDDHLSTDRGLELASCAPKTIQLLCSGTQSDIAYTRGGYSDLTQAIIVGLRNGDAGGYKLYTTLEDVAEYLYAIGLCTSETKCFRTYGANGRILISANPNRGHTLPAYLVSKLFDNDSKICSAAIHQLQQIISAGSTDSKRLATAYLELFRRLRPNQHAHINKLLARAFESNKREKEQLATGILYNTRNTHIAREFYSVFVDAGQNVILFDLDMDSRQQTAIDWLASSKKALWLFDEEFHRSFRKRYAHLYDCVQEMPAGVGPDHAILWIDRRPKYGVRPFLDRYQEFELSKGGAEAVQSVFLDQVNGSDFSGRATNTRNLLHPIQADSELFFSSLNYQTEQLNAQPASAARPMPPAAREPKFLIFRRDNSYLMAICDIKANVNPAALQLSYEPTLTAELASPDEVDNLGFVHNMVDPMFHDPNGQIKRIFVDANIFFQYLMFPRSEVVLPHYASSETAKQKHPISSFVRALLQIHGERVVVFSNIVKSKGFADECLLDLLMSNNIFTRFAPTPSNSLHIGSIRTALISYLLYSSDRVRNKFHIRFDDTNVDKKIADKNVDIILDDLRWLGIDVGNHFRQSDQSSIDRYELAARLLGRMSYCKVDQDESIKLDLDCVDQKFTYWLDLRRGPQIQHGLPTVSSNRKPLDYSLTWPGGKRFKYKFAGAVDDVMSNSLVVRDVRQDHSSLTARQSILIGCIRDSLAFPRSVHADRQIGKFKRIVQTITQQKARPFPFPCPPVYLHVSRVCASDGTALSKRDLLPDQSIAYIRRNGIYFGETILIWCVRSFGMKFIRSIGCNSVRELLQNVTTLGAVGFLRYIERDLNVKQLIDSCAAESIRIEGLRKIDYQVLRLIAPQRLKEFALELIAESSPKHEGNRIPSRLHGLLARLHHQRSYFYGATEISELLLSTSGRRVRSADAPGTSRPSSLVGDAAGIAPWIRSLDPEQKRWVRCCCTGSAEGAPLSVLVDVLGPEQFISLIQMNDRANDRRL